MNRIKQLRLAKGWTQDDLGDKLCVKRAAISKYENGGIPLTDDTIRKLSEIFEKSADYILGLTDDNEDFIINKIDIPKEYTDKYKVTSRDKKQYLEEMKKANESFFMNDEFNDEAKKDMLDLMSELFWDAKAKNKRKK
ncbi:helix-turn-helix domain-containing protein [Clostridium beijerinckii]|uniref:helix-turn-helix domain-containing protein n=1 Tax=Clostridium beijerinckii TaxID=1520 RepID=UPI0003F8A80A|nr:helix-turn-helix transcriptional regulator [Clostridium beijerinckii]NOW85956.1 transcriptional regulator with XRE-family HTH domain [Clostridium beijerinckii]NRT77677.1 transcriptional regulator with XRE-family HTH domain [Clostridium beijerinckii]OOM50421.1 HTH-type transcriptional regulator Xre [Clostridium beijerinckii]